jgi:hypothetical protein
MLCHPVLVLPLAMERSHKLREGGREEGWEGGKRGRGGDGRRGEGGKDARWKTEYEREAQYTSKTPLPDQGQRQQ